MKKTEMNRRNLLVSIILIAFQCRNNALLLGVQQKAVFNNLTSRSFAVGDSLISRTRPTLPPGRCHVSLTVNPSPAILGSLVTFYSMLNCSVIPPIEYQCCYYFWQDNFSENTSMTVGLMTSFLSKIYEPWVIMKNKYIMEVMVCWKKILVKSQRKDLKNSVCNYFVALNTTIFELTVTLNGFLKFKQDRDYRGSPSVLMVGKESVAMFVPTDQRLEMLTYKWRVNASIYVESRNSSIHFMPANVGMISVEVHVFDNVSHNIGHFKHSIQCKDPILDAFIKGDKQLLVESNGTFIVTYVGSAPFSFCWRVEPSDYSEDWTCMHNLSNTVGNVMGSAVFSVQANSQSGQQKIIANLTNDVSKKVLTFQFRVFPTVNIKSRVLVIILIVGVLMSSLLTYMFCHKQPERRPRQRLPVEVADFDFYPGGLRTKNGNSIQSRLQEYYDFRILPFLIRFQQFFRPTTQKQKYVPVNGSCHLERTVSSYSSVSEDPSENVQMKTLSPDIQTSHDFNYGTF